MITRRRRQKRKPNRILAGICALIFMVVLNGCYTALQISPSLPRNHIQTQPDMMLVYDLRPNANIPEFLQEVNVDESFVPRHQNFMDIDLVHRTGQYHMGTSQFVMDKELRILMVKRGPQLKTCPNAWMMIGEHSIGDESPLETAKRGMLEELGPNMIREIRFYKPLTVNPLFYYQEMGDRIDRQLLYTYLVQLNSAAQDLRLEFDDEVSNYKWVTLDELENWVLEEYAIIRSGGQSTMCHESIVRLIQVCLERLQVMVATHSTARNLRFR